MPPSTRSASASLTSPAKRAVASSSPSPAKRARKAATPNGTPATAATAAGQGTQTQQQTAGQSSSPVRLERPKLEFDGEEDPTSHFVLRPKLAFDLDEAKRHLATADPRFQPMFDRLPCKPFEEENDLNPFRALCSSILGQQISWLAARSITHKFVRLVAFPELPEKPEPTGMTTLFPTPRQVATTDMATLRSAGLSQRKAEYVQDLATRFADGRLSAQKLVDMTDEEVMQALIEVRGIGKWTVEMFMIFTLRRPNVLPCGDLGIQKGLVRWHTQVNPSIHVRKLPNPQGAVKSEDAVTLEPPRSPSSATAPILPGTPSRNVATPVVGSQKQDADGFAVPTEPPATPSASSVPAPMTPPPSNAVRDEPLLTPRSESVAQLPPFPESQTLTRSSLRARLSKKVKGNNYLTPQEMEELSKSAENSLGIQAYFCLYKLQRGHHTEV